MILSKPQRSSFDVVEIMIGFKISDHSASFERTREKSDFLLASLMLGFFQNIIVQLGVKKYK